MVELEPSSTWSSLHLSHRESAIQSQSLQKASSIRWDLYKPWAWALLAQSVLHVFLMDPPCRHRALSPKQWRERCTLEGNLRFSPSLFISFFLFLFSFFSFYFPLKEQREKWSSPRRRLLSEVTTPRSCSTRVSPWLVLTLGPGCFHAKPCEELQLVGRAVPRALGSRSKPQSCHCCVQAGARNQQCWDAQWLPQPARTWWTWSYSMAHWLKPA